MNASVGDPVFKSGRSWGATFWSCHSERMPASTGSTSKQGSAALFTISPCAGDLRAPDTFSSDQFLSKCRAYRAESTLAFGTSPSAVCKLNAGQKYYLNVAMTSPLGQSMSTTQTTCDVGTSCEVNLNAPQ